MKERLIVYHLFKEEIKETYSCGKYKICQVREREREKPNIYLIKFKRASCYFVIRDTSLIWLVRTRERVKRRKILE